MEPTQIIIGLLGICFLIALFVLPFAIIDIKRTAVKQLRVQEEIVVRLRETNEKLDTIDRRIYAIKPDQV